MIRRAMFWDEDAARAVAERLQDASGQQPVEVLRDRFAGEDDDEDHPWAVPTDAPDEVLEPLLAAYDGWLDVERPPHTPTAVAPMDLPRGPRRFKRAGPPSIGLWTNG